MLMIAEIVSNGMLSLPNAMAAVGPPSQQYEYVKMRVLIRTHRDCACVDSHDIPGNLWIVHGEATN